MITEREKRIQDNITFLKKGIKNLFARIRQLEAENARLRRLDK